FSGTFEVSNGQLTNPAIEIRGRSLLHSVALTTEAFKHSFLGDGGQYLVTLGLLLFAFSTAIAWSYYGDRAMTYLFGVRAVMPYRVAYIIAFFAASVTDTSLVWLVSAITLALMAIPNLIGITLLRREMKQAVGEYWERFHREFPDVKAPRK
ncbi:MAG: alanine:cation symporter family protein, partial [Pseudomonadales bacterium]